MFASKRREKLNKILKKKCDLTETAVLIIKVKGSSLEENQSKNNSTYFGHYQSGNLIGKLIVPRTK